MAQRTLKEGGSVALELLFVIPIPFIALMLVLAVVRVTDAVSVTLLGARFAAWAERLPPAELDRQSLLTALQGLSSEIGDIRIQNSGQGNLGRLVASWGSFDAITDAPGLSQLKSRNTSEMRMVTVESDSSSFWGGTRATVAVVRGGLTAEELRISNGRFRAFAATAAAPGVLGLAP